MNKQFYALLAAASLALSACSDSNAPSEQSVSTASAASAPAAAANSAAHTANPAWPTYKVGTEANFPPFQYRNEQGMPIGFEVELLQAVANAGEFNVQIVHSARKEWEKTLGNNQFGIWSSAFTTSSQYTHTAAFSKPFLTVENVVNVLDNDANRSVQAAQDLKGKRIAASSHSKSAPEIIPKLTGQDALLAPTFYLALKDMYAGKSDGVFGQNLVLAYYGLENPKFKMRPISIGEQKKEMVFLVHKDNAELLAKINKGLDRVRADGTYTKLVTKWFGEQVAATQH